MRYFYDGFIPENTAPPGATGIAIYDSKGKKVHSMGLGFLTPPQVEPLYSFGLLSDTHICPETAQGAIVSARLDAALTWFEQHGAVLVAHCGDAVNVGFENPKGTYNPEQFVEYKRIRDLHPNLPVYASSGNHESYNAPISDYQDEYVQYMGHDIRFTVTHGDDVFIFMGMPKSSTLYVDGSTLPVPELAWLENQLS